MKTLLLPIVISLAVLGSAFGQAIPGSIPIAGPVAPTDTADTFPSHLALYGKGGMRSVANSSERDALPSERREAGMLVWVANESKLYRLGSNLTNWVWTVDDTIGSGLFTGVKSNLTALASHAGGVHGQTFLVLGGVTPGDWVEPQPYTLFTNSVAATNRCVIAAAGAGRWVHPWKGDPRVFGVRVSNSTNDAAANDAALRDALFYSRSTGIGIQLPPGDTYLLGNYDASLLTEIRGYGRANNPIETRLIFCTKGAHAFTNITAGTKFSDFGVKPLFESWVRDDTNSTVFVAAPNTQVNNCEWRSIFSKGFFRFLTGEIFDCTIADVQSTGIQGYVVGGGSHNRWGAVAHRGNINVCVTNSSTAVTIPTYTAGTTNFTVSDGQPLRVGDIVAVLAMTAPGYTNAIPAKNWGRRVTAVSGNDVTISHPWPTSFTSGTLTYLLGQGFSAIASSAEDHFGTINVEWGSWTSCLDLTGPGAFAVDTMHIEGWTSYAPGGEVYAIKGARTGVSMQYLNMVNCTSLDTTGFNLFGNELGYNVDFVFVRDIDMFQATKLLFSSKTKLTPRDIPSRIGTVLNYGVPLGSPSAGFWERNGGAYRFGEDFVLKEPFGTGNQFHYAYPGKPTVGGYLAGDWVFTATNILICTTSGSYDTPAGQYKWRTGSRVLVADNTGRDFLARRRPITISGAQRWALAPNQTGVGTYTLASNVVAGARDVWVTSTPWTTYGEWVIFNFDGETREDARIQRIYVGTTPRRVHFNAPLVNSYDAGTTFELGTYMNGTAPADVTNLTAIAVSAPAFASPTLQAVP